MIVAQISTIPIGTESTSISGFVAEAVKALKASGLKVMVTPTGTVVEAKNLWELFRAVEKCHEA
ncbi:MAG: MTH1187 family thiamine-binding protein, partial [Candidatus Verstraetearchaeota archaeon]|nr:MTH1187 family thiamine-binding protein [Candidatus Verstraetearchaeota archaeon]